MRKQYEYAYTPRWMVKERVYLARKKAERSLRLSKSDDVRKKRGLQEEAFTRAKENRANPTPTEAYFANFLKQSGVRFIAEWVYFYSKWKYRIIDFYLPDHRISVELDGGYHNQPEVQKYDRFKDQYTRIFTYRFNNEDVFKEDFLTNFLEALHRRALKKSQGD
jgi:very-short-patch-repair endonuclease